MATGRGPTGRCLFGFLLVVLLIPTSVLNSTTKVHSVRSGVCAVAPGSGGRSGPLLERGKNSATMIPTPAATVGIVGSPGQGGDQRPRVSIAGARTVRS